jgi:hypothetical protein
MKNKILSLVIVFFLASVHIYSQVPEPIACETTTGSGPESTTYGRYKPAQTGSGEYFRILIAYAQFASDNTQDSNWPLNQLPTWKNDIIDTAVTGSYRDQTLSDYFDVASNNKFDFIGDVYQDTIIIPTDMTYSDANKYVIDELNANISDFSRYDNWKLVNGNHVFTEGGSDGYLDMLIIIYRNGHAYIELDGGIAKLGISPEYITHDSIKINGGTSAIGSGITTRVGLKGKFTIVGHLAHEFGHYLFGEGHTNFGGLMVGAPHTYDTGKYMMNAWERTWLGYIAPTVPSTDGQQIVLGDFVTDNAAIKIPIPFNNPSSSTFLMVENHQRVSKYDQIMRGESLEGNWNLTTTLGKGLYIWVITNGNNWSPTIDIKAADGAWDWGYDGDYYAGPGWYTGKPWEGYLPKTKRSAVNRNTGKSDHRPDHIYWNGHWASKWMDINPLTKQYELTRDVMGDNTDAFNIGYNEILTPWSNPSSYVNGTTDISLELVSQSGNNITVKVYSTSSSALALPPSKPQNLKVTSVNNFAQLTWEANIEPDMQYSGKYKIYRTSTSGGEPTTFWYVATINAYNGTTPVTSWTDPDPAVGTGTDKLFYHMTAVDNGNAESVPSDYDWVYWSQDMQKQGHTSDIIVTEYKLYNNYPNPFNPKTTIEYQIKEKGFVNVSVYDILGNEVARLVNEVKDIGRHYVNFDASNLTSGVYIYSLTEVTHIDINIDEIRSYISRNEKTNLSNCLIRLCEYFMF